MKRITHIFAAIATAVFGFTMTPAGQSLIHQYPVLSTVVGLGLTLKALYHNPKEGQ